MFAAAILLASAIDPAVAGKAFDELDAMCRADAEKLWGRTLCGPVVFADPQTREVIARKDGEITTSKLPESIGIANHAVEWNGERWTMVRWPLPQDTFARRALLAHESFHRIQQSLGFRQNNPGNQHLDSLDGRALLRLEWRALARALRDPKLAKESLADALAFRARRRSLVEAAAEEERQLEMHEGLAEHTGYALAEPNVDARVSHVLEALKRAEEGDNFTRGFAYTSGPAWGALLDRVAPGWTRKLSASDDLGALAAKAYEVAPAKEVYLGRYDGAALYAAESKRDAERRALLEALHAKFVAGPVLIIPLTKFSFVFDPNAVTPFGTLGTVYRTLEVRDAWGKIVAKEGLISSDFQSLIVRAPENTEARAGEGWALTLGEGWKLVPGKRSGDYKVDQKR